MVWGSALHRRLQYDMSHSWTNRRVVILDRDGTIVIDRHYLDNPEGLAFLPGAAEGLRSLYEHGYRLVVITNQSGIDRGYFSLAQMELMHDRLLEMVRIAGARLEGIYFCPHNPDAGCSCRKPQPGLLLRAAFELGFDPSNVIVVGDKASDIELGNRVAAPTVLISRAAAATQLALPPDFIAGDLSEMARFILERANAV
jgi:D-glycero-D-manno-heptose 1,7-bisphosphate phosphatase